MYRKAIPRLLSQIRSPSLEEVYFECTTFALPHRPAGGKKYLANRSWIHNFLDWDLLAVVLARNPFGDLRKLCFVCPLYYGARFTRLISGDPAFDGDNDNEHEKLDFSTMAGAISKERAEYVY